MHTRTGSESVVLAVDDRKFERWTSYSFNSDFLVPTDGWSFSLGGDAISKNHLEILKPGKSVRLLIDGQVQCSGYIDVVDAKTTRGGGAVLTVEGRDKFAPVVDSQIDTRKQWPNGVSLEKFIVDTLKPFGFTTFHVDNEHNVSVQAGKAINRRTVRKKLSEYSATRCKPQDNECYFSFISRITQRHGLWIWPTVDGEGVVVSNPDFDQPARYRIINRIRNGSENNVLEGGIRRDSTGQPSFIVGKGNIPPRQFQRAKMYCVLRGPVGEIVSDDVLKMGIVNQASYNDAPLDTILGQETVVVESNSAEWRNEFASSVSKPLFLTDDHSRTIDELRKFVQREMSLRTRHAIVGRYVIKGHALNDQPIAIDTVVHVVDEASDWDRPMWIKSRTFRKDRQNGTVCEIECLPLNSLVF